MRSRRRSPRKSRGGRRSRSKSRGRSRGKRSSGSSNSAAGDNFGAMSDTTPQYGGYDAISVEDLQKMIKEQQNDPELARLRGETVGSYSTGRNDDVIGVMSVSPTTTVSTVSNNDGAICLGPDMCFDAKTIEAVSKTTEKLKTKNCVWNDWGEWSQCDKPCGKGIQIRKRSIKVYPTSDGKQCTGEEKQQQECNEHDCPVNCVVSDWNQWSDCSKPCAGGVKSRNRKITSEPKFNGEECPVLSEELTCNEEECPVHCSVSDWTPWSECNKKCGSGLKTRNRKVLNREKYGGDKCPSTEETQVCNELPCATDCEVSDWGAWGDCSKECGGGSQKRNRKITVQPKDGGKKCPVLEESRDCNKQPCPIDCELSPWTEFSQCSKECNGGTKKRTRTIKKPTSDGGVGCGALEDVQQCNVQPCPSDCTVSDWSTWSECTADCGSGNQFRTRTVISNTADGGKTCPKLKEERKCNEQPCAEDCAVGNWSSWTNCSKECGTGTQKRNRLIKSASKNNGKECPVLEESQECNTEACPTDCVMSKWSSWSTCTKDCGTGTQRRDSHVIAEPKDGGASCPQTHETRQCNTHECSVDCKLSPWGEWSRCTKTCGIGSQDRTRTVLTNSANSGVPCANLKESRECNTQDCATDCVVSDWGQWEKCDKECEGGKQSRHRLIKTDVKNGGRECPPIIETRSCNNDPCGFNPKSISGLKTWLDADNESTLTFEGGRVSKWTDRSGNGGDVERISSMPIVDKIGSRKALMFKSSGNYSMQGTAPQGLTEATLYMVFSLENKPGMLFGSDSGWNIINWGGVEGSQTFGVSSWRSDSWGLQTSDLLNKYQSKGAVIMELQIKANDASNKFSSLRFNGGPNVGKCVKVCSRGSWDTLFNDRFRIGGNGWHNPSCKIGEYLLFDRKLSDVESKNINEYLMKKWLGEVLSITSTPSTAGISTEGLSCWLKADSKITKNNSQQVSKWEDNTSNALNFIQANDYRKPLFVENGINNLPALQFISNKATMLMGSGKSFNAQDFTLYMVLKINQNGSSYGNDIFGKFYSPGSNPWNSFNIEIFNKNNISINVSNPNYSSKKGPGLQFPNVFLLAVKTSPSGTSEMIINGKSYVSWERNNTQIKYNSGPFYLGAWPGMPIKLNTFDGYLGEFMLFDKKLDDGNFDKVTSYLNNKWKIY